jgi:hypothetical protein
LSKRLCQEQNQQIQNQIAEVGYDGKVAKNGVILVETEISCWKFKLSDNVIVLYFTTHTVYRGVRTARMEFERSATWEEKLQRILQKIDKTDRKFYLEVGSPKVQQMVGKLQLNFVKNK